MVLKAPIMYIPMESKPLNDPDNCSMGQTQVLLYFTDHYSYIFENCILHTSSSLVYLLLWVCHFWHYCSYLLVRM